MYRLVTRKADADINSSTSSTPTSWTQRILRLLGPTPTPMAISPNLTVKDLQARRGDSTSATSP